MTRNGRWELRRILMARVPGLVWSTVGARKHGFVVRRIDTLCVAPTSCHLSRF